MGAAAAETLASEKVTEPEATPIQIERRMNSIETKTIEKMTKTET